MTDPAHRPPPAMVVVAHGSRDPRAAVTVEALAVRVRAMGPGVDVAVAYLEHARPGLDEALTSAYERGHRRAVVVPLLLTAAYHSNIDLPRQIAAARVVVTPERVAGASGAWTGLVVRQAAVLGPHPALLAALERRIHEAGIAPRDPRWGLVVAAAGSSYADAQVCLNAAAAELRRRGWSAAVTGFASSASPSVPEAVALLRERGVPRVAVASYLLAPGRFSDALRSCGADLVSPPLGDASEVAELVIRRYRMAAPALAIGRCRPSQRVPTGRESPITYEVHL